MEVKKNIKIKENVEIENNKDDKALFIKACMTMALESVLKTFLESALIQQDMLKNGKKEDKEKMMAECLVMLKKDVDRNAKNNIKIIPKNTLIELYKEQIDLINLLKENLSNVIKANEAVITSLEK